MLLYLLVINGCGGTDYQYESATEKKPGPGLFSGEDGVFTVIKKDKADSGVTTQKAIKQEVRR